MIYAEKAESTGISKQTPPIGHTPPSKTDILLALWKRTKWLDSLIDKVEGNKAQLTEKTKSLVYMSQVHAQLCKTMLYGLKEDTKKFEVSQAEPFTIKMWRPSNAEAPSKE
jgi:hypothetical protein